jgi:hypothetical protein
VCAIAFSSMVEGKNEDISTIELSGGARIHYIFQSIFVKSLEVCKFVAYTGLLDLSVRCMVSFIRSMLSGGLRSAFCRVLTLARMSPMKTSAWLYKMQLVLGVLCLYLRYIALVPFCVRTTVLICRCLHIGQLAESFSLC